MSTTANPLDCTPEAPSSADLDRWRDEGGTGVPRRRAAKSTAAVPPVRANRDARDTAAGCFERAAADLLKAAPMVIANERARMEASAASWTARAELLTRLEASFEARKASGGLFDSDPDALRS